MAVWNFRGDSSAGLERLPVTQKVAGSSPVHPAILQRVKGTATGTYAVGSRSVISTHDQTLSLSFDSD